MIEAENHYAFFLNGTYSGIVRALRIHENGMGWTIFWTEKNDIFFAYNHELVTLTPLMEALL
jgi:hypothetical protein